MTPLHVLTSALALGLATAPSHAAGDGERTVVGTVAAGQVAFARCASCHQIGPSARAGFGPALTGVIGRAAASTPDFRYSAALKASGIVWTEATLSAFLRAPSEVVPGNAMRFYGIGDDQRIADLLAYLKSFR